MDRYIWHARALNIGILRGMGRSWASVRDIGQQTTKDRELQKKRQTDQMHLPLRAAIVCNASPHLHKRELGI